jgi:hypothetical protein
LHVRHEGIKREMRLARGDTDIQRRGKAAMAKIEQTAAAIQVQVISSKKGTRSVHRSPSSVTEAIEESLSLGDAYRILSQIAHAHTMSLINTGMVELRQPAETSGNGVVMLERRVLAEHAAFLFATAFRAFSRAAWSHARYFGWDELRFEEIIDNAADRIRLAPAVRFWRY